MTCLKKRIAFIVLLVLASVPATVAAKARPNWKARMKSAVALAAANPAAQTIKPPASAQNNNQPQQFSGSGGSAIQIVVMPLSAQVGAGSQQQFTASVTGASSPVVLWSVSGAGCLNLSCGYISGDGLYFAPASPPSPPTVTVKATSFADFVTSSSASITITPVAAPAVVVSPNATQLSLGTQQQFTAKVTGTANTQVFWSIVNNGCGFNCGYINSSGLYTAPSSLPSVPTITIAAQLSLFPPVTGSAQVGIKPPINGNGGLTITPGTLQLPARGLQSFTATINGGAVFATWSLSGPSCTPAICGTITSAGFYSAPSNVAVPTTVTITANSIIPPGKSGNATVTLQPPVSVSVTPQNAVINTSAQQQFTATVSNTTNSAVLWSISCLSNSCGSINANAVYTAPSIAPNPNRVTITAASLADLSQRASATISVVGAGTAKVSISPSSNLQLSAGSSQLFTASVTGPVNTAVTWSVLGIGCIGPNCGTITQGGIYTAPLLVSGAQMVTITATSQANPTASASATVQLVPLVGIAIVPSNPQITSGAARQFSATVTGSLNPTALWSIVNCFAPNACGAISDTGLYTAPSGVASPIAVTIMAAAQANPSKTDSKLLTVVPQVAVSVSPSGIKASVNSQQQYRALVTGSSDTTVNWTVSGPGCSGSACGTIMVLDANTALYQAPPSIPTPATASVIATLASDPTKSGSAALTIVPSNNSKLLGHYAFRFSGFDGSVPYQAAGTFTADGNGNLINGIEDINCGLGAVDVICGSSPVLAMSFTGTYNLNADGRGIFTINSSLSTSTFALAIAPTSGDAKFIASDVSGIRGTGILKPQVSSNVLITGTEATGLVGVDSSGARIGMIGSMAVNPGGQILGATLQVNDGGQPFTLPVAGPNLTGNFTLDPPGNLNGRFRAELDAPGLGSATCDKSLSSTCIHFSMYVVSAVADPTNPTLPKQATELSLLSIDPVSINPLLGGQVLQQQLPANLSYFQAGNAIFSSSGFDGLSAKVIIGKLSFSALNNISLSGTTQVAFDQNNGGIVTSNKSLTGTYLLQSTGEVTMSATGSPTFYAYPFGLNSGFLLDSSTSVLFGKIESQNISIIHNFAFGTNELMVPDGAMTTGTGTLNLPQMAGNEDLSQSSGFTPGLAFNGTWPTSFSDGSGKIYLTSPAQQTLTFWVVSFSKVVAVETDPTALSPSLLVFEQ